MLNDGRQDETVPGMPIPSKRLLEKQIQTYHKV